MPSSVHGRSARARRPTRTSASVRPVLGRSRSRSSDADRQQQHRLRTAADDRDQGDLADEVRRAAASACRASRFSVPSSRSIGMAMPRFWKLVRNRPAAIMPATKYWRSVPPVQLLVAEHRAEDDQQEDREGEGEDHRLPLPEELLRPRARTGQADLSGDGSRTRRRSSIVVLGRWSPCPLRSCSGRRPPGWAAPPPAPAPRRRSGRRAPGRPASGSSVADSRGAVRAAPADRAAAAFRPPSVCRRCRPRRCGRRRSRRPGRPAPPPRPGSGW